MRSFLVRGAAALGLLACLWIPVRAARQIPGDGWIMSPSPPRMVKILYWELANQTEVWLRVTPRSKDGVEIPASLVFSATYKGNVTKAGAITRPPDAITLQAVAAPAAFYTTTDFALTGDHDRPVTLSPPNGNVMVSGGCDSCGGTSVRVQMTPATLTALTENSKVSGNVLGMTCHLERDDLDAIRKFARYIDVLR